MKWLSDQSVEEPRKEGLGTLLTKLLNGASTTQESLMITISKLSILFRMLQEKLRSQKKA